jgi:signal transduction histidine kinase
MVLEETLELADGRTLSRSFVPLSLPDGEGTLWLYRDVTDRIRREADLQRQNERLDEFANLVSHDLRNPLDVAEGKLELAREECGSDHLESVAQSHARMRVLIEDLLRYAQEGTDVTDREAVDLAALVESSWEVVDTAGATLDVETTATVRADRTRCKQLLENVLRNAVDHGGEDVTITVGDCEEGAGFFVADDGPGIPPGKREAVLESGVSTSADGTGFGLAIVRQIAEGHGWDVAVTESAAGGARLEFTGVDRPD